MIDKRFKKILEDLQELVAKVDKIYHTLQGQDSHGGCNVTKEQLMSIKGIGDSKADEILKLINGS